MKKKHLQSSQRKRLVQFWRESRPLGPVRTYALFNQFVSRHPQVEMENIRVATYILSEDILTALEILREDIL